MAIEASKDYETVFQTHCAILNSTLQALFYEFAGRYIENRDKTISNEIKIYELKNIVTLDPSKLNQTQIKHLENSLDKLINKEIGLKSLYDPKDMMEREELDKIVFCDILGLSEAKMKEVREALAEMVRRRIERAQVKKNAKDFA